MSSSGQRSKDKFEASDDRGIEQPHSPLISLVRLLARQAAREALAESAAVPDAPDGIRATGSEADDDGR